MKDSPRYSCDIAFTDSVKAIQTLKNSRHTYARMEQSGSWETIITSALKDFIESQTSVFFATANTEGQPYIQHRGGPAGFLHVLDDRTIGFVDYSGNRQFITTGNLAENPKSHLFLMDYMQKRRVKIWGEASVVERDEKLVAQMMPSGYKARAEQIIILNVVAWDENCPQHIPHRLEVADFKTALAIRDERIATLESEIEKLRLSNL